MSLYTKRGVSAQKEEVHAATRHLDQGLYPKAFCKIYKDVLCGDDKWVNVMHADGAGTKSILAYLYWKETGDVSIWKGIAQDAIVMNLDDLVCVGIYDNLLFSSTIDRNKNVIPAEVLEAVINGSQEFFDTMNGFGINITFMGGETADVGDVVRTMAVNGTMTARWPKAKLITNENIQAGDVIVGLAGFGQANYETSYNSGLASNGLTSARHDLLHKTYGARFPESYDTSLEESVVYIGPHKITDEIKDGERTTTIGQLLLSPTRTFAPVMKELLENHFDAIHGLVHCSGGGQTKCLKYVPENVRIIKDNLFEPPIIFKLIREASKSDDREMYQVFNMGTRLEIYTNEKYADVIISVANRFGVDAKVIGRVEASEKKELILKTPSNELVY
ncbi:MAG: phosphoribosylformylglycinamidine cyclo-ligase [Chitinophagaceae bacterium]|jgi:phosphoribosylformylglycinamidine cyclo-ligase|nr:phosphoribosylformylglycinamidine cyclo-ligase [Chitinophagaceae bacterium]NLH78439.1 phosphoribosylformylglycinamidine cyclo-ligase [Acidobacteriota bacterium]MBK8299246.1 phosphoribosylformylglycinamidine cyclo-ligase [Chitinophagaceae bacterium]MBK9463299.1 phosphoribosylformylglycinamidine cyclo-ligase [Chitinophagaceae bacterium]MBK9659574.1 phosphoribosylformylglycinamidine cyclo-ligase [Chitinophagaceae bacterium]